MKKKKTLIRIGAFLFLLFSVLFSGSLIYLIWEKPWTNNRAAAPAVIPNGSVLVWRQTAGYYKEGNYPKVLQERFLYDDFGRVVRVENYADEIVKPDPEEEILYTYDPKTIRTLETTVFLSPSAGDPPSQHTMEYDSDGNPLNAAEWHFRDATQTYVKDSEEVYLYNSNGERDGQVSIRYDNWGNMDHVMNAVLYDEQNHTRSLYNYYPSGTEKQEYLDRWKELLEIKISTGEAYLMSEETYDDHGELVRYKFSEVEGSQEYVTLSYENQYDSEGRLLAQYEVNEKGGKRLKKEMQYFPDGGYCETFYDPDQTITVEYDDQGREIKTSAEYPKDPKWNRVIYTYEYLAGGGRREKGEFYDLLNHLTETNREWNAQGVLMYSDGITDGTCVIELKRTYDDAGRLVELCEGDTVTAYKYDENGNLIKMISKRPDMPLQTWEFEYTPMILTEEDEETAEKYYVRSFDPSLE